MDSAVRNRSRGRAKEVYSSYGDLAVRLLPPAVQFSFLTATGEVEWSRGAGLDLGQERTLIQSMWANAALGPRLTRLDESLVAIAIPVAPPSKTATLMFVCVLHAPPAAERHALDDTVNAAAPLVDCLCRELEQQNRKSPPSATLSERTAELEWLFALTENLHSNSSDPRAIGRLLSAAVERMRASFGAVVVPDHGLKLTYSSIERMDRQAGGVSERCAPYFMSFVTRKKQPLIANRAAAASGMPPFKALVLPIEPRKGRVIGYIAFLKAASLPSFGRRQVFLGRHLGHQAGAMLESQYDLATGLLTRQAWEQDIQKMSDTRRDRTTQSLIYAAIDGLSAINDELGFSIGDEAIVRIADLLRAPVLPADAVTSRFGGDSFLIYLPDHDADAAAARARDLVEAASACVVGGKRKTITLSINCGVVRLIDLNAGLDAPIAAARQACVSGPKSQRSFPNTHVMSG